MDLKVLRNWIGTEHIEVTSRAPEPGERIMLRYGPFQPYKTGIISEAIPEPLVKISERLVQEGLMRRLATNVLVNVYGRGASIPFHVDDRTCGEEIAVLNVEATGHLLWMHPMTQERDETFLEPGDLLVMSGARRSMWHHAVAPLDNAERRISIVFRYNKHVR